MLGTVVISGEDVCCIVVFGTLVGVFVFSVMWSELLMTSAISCTLWSSVYECQRVECAIVICITYTFGFSVSSYLVELSFVPVQLEVFVSSSLYYVEQRCTQTYTELLSAPNLISELAPSELSSGYQFRCLNLKHNGR